MTDWKKRGEAYLAEFITGNQRGIDACMCAHSNGSSTMSEDELAHMDERQEVVNEAMDGATVFIGSPARTTTGEKTPEFKAWIGKWELYFSTLSETEQEMLRHAVAKGADCSTWYPAEGWENFLLSQQHLPFPSHKTIIVAAAADESMSLITNNFEKQREAHGYSAKQIGDAVAFAHHQVQNIVDVKPSEVCGIIDKMFPQNRPFAALAKKEYLKSLRYFRQSDK